MKHVCATNTFVGHFGGTLLWDTLALGKHSCRTVAQLWNRGLDITLGQEGETPLPPREVTAHYQDVTKSCTCYRCNITIHMQTSGKKQKGRPSECGFFTVLLHMQWQFLLGTSTMALSLLCNHWQFLLGISAMAKQNQKKHKMTRPNSLPLLPPWGVQYGFLFFGCFGFLFFDFLVSWLFVFLVSCFLVRCLC